MVVLVLAWLEIRTPFNYGRRAVVTIGPNSASPIYCIFIAFFHPKLETVGADQLLAPVFTSLVYLMECW